MRRLLLCVIAVTLTTAPAWLEAQSPVLTFSGAYGIPVKLERSTDGGKTFTPSPLGATSPSGALSLTSVQIGLLAGKPVIDIRFDTCPQNNAINLFPAGPGSQAEEDKCPPGCSCSRKKAAFAWGNSFTGQTPFGPSAGPGGQSFFFDNPLSFVVIGGGVAGGIIIAKHGGSDTGTSTGMETRLETDVVNHAFGGQFAAGSNGCGFNSSGGTVTFSGTAPSTTGIFVESSGTLISSASGSVTQNATTMQYSFGGSASGSIVGLGAYNSTAVIHFDTGNGISGTLTLNFGCGTVVLTVTGSR